MARPSRGVLIVLAALIACAHYQRYQPASLEPALEQARYRARALDDPALLRFLSAQDVRVGNADASDSGWTSRELALAALYYRADLAEARGTLAAARAGEITAGARPAPSVDGSIEHAARVDEGKSTPWSISLSAGLTLELGGKRAARLARARAVTLGARLRLETAAWAVAQNARTAALAAIVNDEALADQRLEDGQLRAVAQLLAARYSEGQISRAEIARAAADVRSAEVQLAQLARARTEARVALAGALAIPPTAVESLALEPDARSACDVIDSVGRDSIESLALRTRSAVGMALADYAVAEADLRLAVAQQYPDLTIGPGVLWDEGIRRWVLSLAIPALPLQTRGPVAEARARRTAQGARVVAVADSVLAAVDSSITACHSVTPELAVADSLVSATDRALDLAEAAYGRGEVGQTDVALARLAVIRSQHTRRLTAARASTAGAALETAVGQWLTGPAIRWPDLTTAPDSIPGER